jgi:hypothetical protein
MKLSRAQKTTKIIRFSNPNKNKASLIPNPYYEIKKKKKNTTRAQ